MYTSVLLFVVLNLLYLSLLFLVEESELHQGRISKRTKTPKKHFRHLKDWRTVMLGDWAGLSIIDAVFGMVFVPEHVMLVFVSVFVGFIGTYLLHVRCMLPEHVPDSGYPKAGSISQMGLFHLIYSMVQMSICSYLLLEAMTIPFIGLPLVASLIGVGVYLLGLIHDIQNNAFSLRHK